MTTKSRVDELFVMRAFAIIAVVLIHATSKPVAELDSASASFFLYKILNTLSTFAVPSFIFMSGFVLVYNYMDKPFTRQSVMQFYKKRLLYIVIPYLFFSVFYFVLVHIFIYDQRDWIALGRTFLADFFIQGRTFYHLYFMYVIVQFYLIFPFVWRLFQKPWFSRHAIWIGVLVQLVFIYGNGYFDLFPKKSIIFVTYFSYFLTGGYLSVLYGEWRKAKRRLHRPIFIWIAWIAVAIWYAFVHYAGQTGLYRTPVELYEIAFILYGSLSSVILLIVSSFVYQTANKHMVNGLVHLGALSFAVYFIHPFFQLFYRKIQPGGQMLWYNVYILGGFALILGISWLVTSVIARHIKYSWLLFGSVPKQLPYR